MSKRDREPTPEAPPPTPYPLEEAITEAHQPDWSGPAAPSTPRPDSLPEGDQQADPTKADEPAEDQAYREPVTGKDRNGNRNGNRNDPDGAEPDRSEATGPDRNLAQVQEGRHQPPSDPSTARARTADQEAPLDSSVPEREADILRRLPQWQHRYVLALAELGGVVSLACRRTNVSRASVEKHQRQSPEFAHACSWAVQHSTDLIEAAMFRGATIGDLQPVYQGQVLVGHKRVRNTRDAELLLRMRGRLGSEQASGPDPGADPARIAPADVGTVVTSVLAALFGAQAARTALGTAPAARLEARERADQA